MNGGVGEVGETAGDAAEVFGAQWNISFENF